MVVTAQVDVPQDTSGDYGSVDAGIGYDRDTVNRFPAAMLSRI